MITKIVRSRIPSELSSEEIKAVRCDNRLQREIPQDYGLTLSAVSSIKSRKCQAEIPDFPIKPPEAPKIVVFVCPPAKASGHKPLRKQMLKPVPEFWKPTARTISVPDTEAATAPPMPYKHHPDDWLLF